MKKKEKTKDKLKLLFICTANVQRSPTAEDLFEEFEDIEAKSAGTHLFAIERVRQHMVDWADKIFVMSEKEDKHISFLKKHFDLTGKEVYDLNISDKYGRNDPKLIKILKNKLSKYFPDYF